MKYTRVAMLVGLTALQLSGCAIYKPPIQGPVAAIDFEFSGNNGHVYLDTKDSCNTIAITFDRQNVPIPAESPIWIQQGYSTSGAYGGSLCEVRYSFAPRVNKKYVSLFSIDSGICTIKILEVLPNGEKAPVQDAKKHTSIKCLGM